MGYHRGVHGVLKRPVVNERVDHIVVDLLIEALLKAPYLRNRVIELSEPHWPQIIFSLNKPIHHLSLPRAEISHYLLLYVQPGDILDGYLKLGSVLFGFWFPEILRFLLLQGSMSPSR